MIGADGKLLLLRANLSPPAPKLAQTATPILTAMFRSAVEYYGSSIRKDATTNSGNYICQGTPRPLGYYAQQRSRWRLLSLYDGQAVMVLDTTCSNKPTEMGKQARPYQRRGGTSRCDPCYQGHGRQYRNHMRH